MELIGIESSKLTALFFASRPEGQPYLPATIAAFVERYRFATHPTRIEEMMADKMTFGAGLFGSDPIDTFDIYPDGVFIQSRCNASVLECFLDDVCKWMYEAAGLRQIEINDINRNFESNVLIKASPTILNVIGGLSSAQKMITKLLKQSAGLDVEFELFGFSLAADATKIPGMKPALFRVERKIQIPFEKNLFISSAPLKTDDHLRILEALENLSN